MTRTMIIGFVATGIIGTCAVLYGSGMRNWRRGENVTGAGCLLMMVGFIPVTMCFLAAFIK